MKGTSRAGLLFVAASLALLVGFEAVGPLRAVGWAQCGLDRVRHGAVRELDGVRVRLPAGWWERERRTPRGTTELLVARVTRTRSDQREPLAIVRHVNFELSRENATAARASLAWESPNYGAWDADELVDVELGGRPGFEIRYDRAGPPVGDPSHVASDFLVPAAHLWVQCSPMSAEDLAQCRAIAASAESR